MAARFGWALTAIGVVFAIADTYVIAASGSLFSEETIAVHGWPFVSIAPVSATALGAMIISRHTRHPIGWLLCLVGSTSSASVLLEGISIYLTEEGGADAQTTSHVAAWFSVLLGGQTALVGLAIVFLIAPNGHFLSARWRPVAWAGVAAVAIFTVGLACVPPTDFTLDDAAYDGRPFAGLATTTGFFLMAVVVIASGASLVVRMRRAGGEQARQLRWFAAGAAGIAFGIGWLVAVEQVNGGEQTWVASLPLFSSYLFLILGIGMAVLRYRLYDLDIIVNRAVVLACGTVFAAGAYTVLVVAVGDLAGAKAASVWPSVAAMVIVAIAFQPLRQSVVKLADRIAYGSRAAPYEALADFSRRLSGSLPGADALLPVVAEAALHAVPARAATVRLIVSNAADLTARCTADAAPAGTSHDVIDIAVVNRGETLGSISVELPHGQPMRTVDHQLLVDLANQTSMAFRNTQLTAELVARVDLVDRQTAELSLSRARIIEARDAQSARIERAIRRDVMPHLARVPVELAALSSRPTDASTISAVQGLAAASRRALEDLRDISRGVYPTQLVRTGVAPAIATLLSRTSPPGLLNLDASVRGQRFDPRIEAAAYFCAVEVIPELRAPIEVVLTVDNGRLKAVFSGSAADEPADTQGIRDRLAPLDGTAVWNATGRRVGVTVVIPTRLPTAGAKRLSG